MDNNKNTKKKRIVPKDRVKITVQRNFIGDKNMSEIVLGIVYEDIKRKMQSHTFDISV